MPRTRARKQRSRKNRTRRGGEYAVTAPISSYSSTAPISSYSSTAPNGVGSKLKEGFLGTLAGFIVGPAVGRVIANALGVEKGILFDMLTSRLVSAALGNAIQKNL